MENQALVGMPWPAGWDAPFPWEGCIVPPNVLIGDVLVSDEEDASQPVRLLLYQVSLQSPAEAALVRFPSGVAVTRRSLEAELSDDLLLRIRAQIASLPDDWYEIFPADHNVRAGSHFPDPWGETTRLLAQLEACVQPLRRPCVLPLHSSTGSESGTASARCRRSATPCDQYAMRPSTSTTGPSTRLSWPEAWCSRRLVPVLTGEALARRQLERADFGTFGLS